jgi:predicted outer membrane repeat protein
MEGGNIEYNDGSASGGGGVVINAFAGFTMSGGAIHDNTGKYGGGVYVANNEGKFTMYGDASITENTATQGGAVGVANGAFEMSGGTIAANTATDFGGAVYCWNNRTFIKTGGIIYGTNADVELANTAVGHVINYNKAKWYDLTANASVNLDTANDTNWSK